MNFSYQVGTEKYFNKLQAIQQNLKTGQPIKFLTPYDVDSDFSVSPENTLDALITKHLRELRDEYKTMKFYYSGGVDSHIILENIILNQIPIDEIVCLKSGIPTADYEIEEYAEPILKKYKNKLHGTKITIKTPTLDDYRNYYNRGVTQEKISLGAVGTHNYFRLHWPLDFYGEEPTPDVLQIRGMEKPKIIKHGDDYYTYFLDGDLEPHANNYQFFSANKDLTIKQSHMFLETFKTMHFENEQDVWKEEQAWNKSIGRNKDQIKTPSKEMYFGTADNHVEYKGIKLYYHNKKERLALTWCQENCPDILQSWYENLEHLKDITYNKWWNDGHPEMGSVGVLTDFYCLTRKDTKTVDELYPDGFKI